MHKRFFAGFTIAELLIVITVIGIIATITIVSYNGVQRRGDDSAIRDNLSKMSDSINTYYSDNNMYPTADSTLSQVAIQTNHASYDASRNYGALVYCTNDTKTEATFLARSTSGRSYYVVSDGPVKEFTGTYPLQSGTPDLTTVCNSILGTSNSSGTWINNIGTTSPTWNYGY